MIKGKFPFEAPEEDLRMSGTTEGGARFSIYDTYCKNFGPEEKEKTDKRIMDIYIRSLQRKFLERKKTFENAPVSGQDAGGG